MRAVAAAVLAWAALLLAGAAGCMGDTPGGIGTGGSKEPPAPGKDVRITPGDRARDAGSVRRALRDRRDGDALATVPVTAGAP